MKKNEALRMLKKLRDFFKEDSASLQNIDTLIVNAENMTNSDESESVEDFSILPLPNELKELNSGFAIFADGACRGNPGPGAWATLIQDHSSTIILKSTGVDVPTTNNKMELEAVIRGLKGLVEKWIEDRFSDRDAPVFVYSDSKYVVEGIEKWVPSWKARGWKKADNKEPENLVLWRELEELKINFNRISFVWVKGHSGHPQNELCDKMANQALDEAGF